MVCETSIIKSMVGVNAIFIKAKHAGDTHRDIVSTGNSNSSTH